MRAEELSGVKGKNWEELEGQVAPEKPPVQAPGSLSCWRMASILIINYSC